MSKANGRVAGVDASTGTDPAHGSLAPMDARDDPMHPMEDGYTSSSGGSSGSEPMPALTLITDDELMGDASSVSSGESDESEYFDDHPWRIVQRPVLDDEMGRVGAAASDSDARPLERRPPHRRCPGTTSRALFL